MAAVEEESSKADANDLPELGETACTTDVFEELTRQLHIQLERLEVRCVEIGDNIMQDIALHIKRICLNIVSRSAPRASDSILAKPDALGAVQMSKPCSEPQAPTEEVDLQKASASKLEAGPMIISNKMLHVFEDAPAGHIAWDKVKFHSQGPGKEPIVGIECRRPDGTRVRSQTTAKACGGSDAHALRIARLLYVKMSDGGSKEDVEILKAQLYRELEDASHASPDATLETSVVEKKQESNVESTPEPNSVNEKDHGGVPAKKNETMASIEDDAPQGHSAWARVFLQSQGPNKNPCVAFRFRKPDGTDTKVKLPPSICGSPEQSCRIARLLFVKMTEGSSLEEVQELKTCLIQQVRDYMDTTETRRTENGESTQASIPEAADAAGQTDDDEEQAHDIKCEAGATTISDIKCEAGATTTSNETSCLLEDAPEGHLAWTKVRYVFADGDPHVRIECRRPDGTIGRSQTTAKACGGSETHALRIARLLYVKIADGGSKQDVDELKNKLYRQLESAKNVESAPEPVVENEKEHGDCTPKKPVVENETDHDGGAPKKEETLPGILQEDAPEGHPALEKAKINSQGPGRPAKFDDAPEGHPAWEKVKLISQGIGRGFCVYCRFKRADGELSKVQIKYPLHGSEEHAFRVGRLLYVKMMEGATTEELAELRRHLSKQVETHMAMAETGESSHVSRPEITEATGQSDDDEEHTRATELEPGPTISCNEMSSAFEDVAMRETSVAENNHKSHVESAPEPDGANENGHGGGAPKKEETLLATLQEDAPEGHLAWQKVKLTGQGYDRPPCVGFRYKKEDGTDGRYKIVTPLCGSEEQSLRVGRLVFVKFMDGGTREEADELKDHLIRQVEAYRDAQAQGQKDNDELMLEDAPDGHEAWEKVRLVEQGPMRLPCVHFKYRKDGKWAQMKITTPLYGSDEHSFRVGRLLYVKMAEGKTTEEVHEYRDFLYRRVKNHLALKDPRITKKNESSHVSIPEAADAAGQNSDEDVMASAKEGTTRKRSNIGIQVKAEVADGAETGIKLEKMKEEKLEEVKEEKLEKMKEEESDGDSFGILSKPSTKRRKSTSNVAASANVAPSSFQLASADDIARWPKILAMYFQSRLQVTSDRTAKQYAQSMRALAERHGFTPESMATEEYLEFVKYSEEATRVRCAALKGFKEFWLLERPAEWRELTEEQSRMSMFQVRPLDRAEVVDQANEGMKLDEVKEKKLGADSDGDSSASVGKPSPKRRKNASNDAVSSILAPGSFQPASNEDFARWPKILLAYFQNRLQASTTTFQTSKQYVQKIRFLAVRDGFTPDTMVTEEYFDYARKKGKDSKQMCASLKLFARFWVSERPAEWPEPSEEESRMQMFQVRKDNVDSNTAPSVPQAEEPDSKSQGLPKKRQRKSRRKPKKHVDEILMMPPPNAEDMNGLEDNEDSKGEDSDSSSSSTSSLRSASAKPAPRGPPRRACAKMLVRSGIRCACHYRPRESCPRKQPPQS